MEVRIKDKRLREALEDESTLKRKYGAEMAKKIRLRMDALVAAESLEVFWPPKSGPERCHQLTGDLDDKFSVDLRHPYRLIFQPAEPAQLAAATDARKRWGSIRSVVILGI